MQALNADRFSRFTLNARKSYTRLSLFAVLVFSLFLGACEETNIDLAAQAGADAIKAVTLSDREIKALAEAASRESDARHTVAGPGNPYAVRLQRIAGSYYESDGFRFDFKVYLSPKVNAFAMADGTIRVYSGLMDILNDEELLFVIGHEMGHVVERHIKRKIMLAYAASSVRKGIASQENIAGDLARSALGGLLQNLLNAQFSQSEEKAADDFGLLFLKEQGVDATAAVSALKKLGRPGTSYSLLSSHPEPLARADRMQQQIDSPETMGDPSFIETWIARIKSFFSALFGSD